MNSLPTNRVRVLIADHSGAVRQRLLELLQENGAVRVVGQAASAGEAWALFEQQRPTAVVLDLRFPDGSGLDLLSRMKQAAPACRVLILTNHHAPVFQDECHRRGADHFLHKAVEFERISELLIRPAADHAESPSFPETRPPLSTFAGGKTAFPKSVAPSPVSQPQFSAPPQNIQPATP